MSKDRIINLLHATVYFLFILTYFFFEQQDIPITTSPFLLHPA